MVFTAGHLSTAFVNFGNISAEVTTIVASVSLIAPIIA